jgi:hypothetical protein
MTGFCANRRCRLLGTVREIAIIRSKPIPGMSVRLRPSGSSNRQTVGTISVLYIGSDLDASWIRKDGEATRVLLDFPEGLFRSWTLVGVASGSLPP